MNTVESGVNTFSDYIERYSVDKSGKEMYFGFAKTRDINNDAVIELSFSSFDDALEVRSIINRKFPNIDTCCSIVNEAIIKIRQEGYHAEYNKIPTLKLYFRPDFIKNYE